MTRRMRRYVPLAGLLVMMATTAAAQNITPGTSVHLLVGQPPIRLNLDGDHYYDAPVVAQRSYCAEASGADDELNATHPVLTLYHSDGTTAFAAQPEIANLEPIGAAASRKCFIAATSETVYIKIAPLDGTVTNHNHAMRFVETTLWSNWFFVGGDYSSLVGVTST